MRARFANILPAESCPKRMESGLLPRSGAAGSTIYYNQCAEYAERDDRIRVLFVLALEPSRMPLTYDYNIFCFFRS